MIVTSLRTLRPSAIQQVIRDSRPDVARSAASAADGTQHRVLVIEDNTDAADSLRDALELEGYAVEVTYSGPQGIEKAKAFPPDIVISDIGLPDVDGYEVARRMRADPALVHVALVALTGYAQPEDVARAKEAGFDAHMAKPPRVEALKGMLEEVNRGSRGASSPEP